MSDQVSLDFIMATLRSVQAEQRSIRSESQIMKEAFSASFTVLMRRLGEFEARMDTRLDQIGQRLDSLERKP